MHDTFNIAGLSRLHSSWSSLNVPVLTFYRSWDHAAANTAVWYWLHVQTGVMV